MDNVKNISENSHQTTEQSENKRGSTLKLTKNGNFANKDDKKRRRGCC